MSKIKLTQEQVIALQTAQRELHDIIPEIDKAEQCGIDCQLYRQLQQEATDRISKMIEHFGPSAR